MKKERSITRRRILMSLAGLAPAAVMMRAGHAIAKARDDVFLQVSRIIAGKTSLSPDVALRVEGLLADRIEGFASKLTDLANVMKVTGGSRDEMLGALADNQVAFALDIARPWYLGYVGTPSSFVLKDDAAFATFLEAQAWQKILHEVPRPTYPPAGAGWWQSSPPGISPPAMPEEIVQWTFHPGGPSNIMAPEPAWKAYATADHVSIAEARKARPGGGLSPSGN